MNNADFGQVIERDKIYKNNDHQSSDFIFAEQIRDHNFISLILASVV